MDIMKEKLKARSYKSDDAFEQDLEDYAAMHFMSKSAAIRLAFRKLVGKETREQFMLRAYQEHCERNGLDA
jgi:Arc/MetJ family transcription regulator